MRVVTGIAKGRRLKAPEGLSTRPTTDNVKESVFNILQLDMKDKRILDLFAGSGQMGIECLSRGAAEAVFVDRDRKAVRIIKENLETCGFSAKVLCADALSFLEHCDRFDLIFIDPPYDSGLYEKVLRTVNVVDILLDDGIIIVESRVGEELPELVPPYRKGRDYRYGNTKISLYHRERTT